MANNPLIESYRKELITAAPIYEHAHGRKMGTEEKVATAQLLSNIDGIFSTQLDESFENSVGTQRSDMGAYKKFCLAVTNVAFPSLIAEDLVLVYPMTSMSGAITYVKYTYGSNKGGITQGQTIADPWAIAPRTEDNARYTSPVISESHEATEEGTVTLAWKPVADVSAVQVDGTAVTDFTWDAATGVVTIPDTSLGAKVSVLYSYDNVYIPQNDLPIINARMEVIPLVAHPRRIAVYYSQIAAFQAQTDYGYDMSKSLAEKACAELAFEIDEEIVRFLAAMGDDNICEAATFNKTLPYGVSKHDHYEGFLENIEIARTAVFEKTQKFYPSYMLIAPDVLPVLSLIDSFKETSHTSVAGPFFAGTLSNMKVFVSPSVGAGKWYLGVNGKEMQTSAAVYAPYMPIVPTQLLGYADGGMSQGFSTLYDLKALNPQLVVGASIVATDRVVYTSSVDSTSTGDTGTTEPDPVKS